MKLFRKKDVRTEFLPSAIEIVETPEAPLGKFSIWAVFLVVVAVIIWSFGKVNEVAIARGKVIPSGNANIIQSFVSGTVKSIEVKEGDDVSEGQTIITLDDKMLKTDKETFERKLENLNASKEMFQAFKEGKNPQIDKEKIKESEEIIKEQLGYSGTLEEIYSNDLENTDINLGNLKKDLDKTQKKLEEEKTNLDKLQKELEALKEDNSEENKINDVNIEMKKSEIDSSEKTIESLEQSIQSKQDNLKVEENKKENQKLNHKQQLEKELVNILSSIEEIKKNIEKIDKQLENLNIKSPVEGKIQNLAVNTIDGVIQPGATLAYVVPKNKELVVEAMILNKDIGFVEEGQKTQVKFDTFDFQRYGTIDGIITHISPDAVTVNNQSLYKATIELDKKEITVNDKTMKFSPGMDVTCEVDTGERRIIDFFIPGINDIKSSFNLR